MKVENRKGSHAASKLLGKWKDSVFNLKLGRGVKRKLEDELFREKKRRKICEEEIANQRKVIKTMQKERNDIVRKLIKNTKKASRKDGSKKAYSKRYIKRMKTNLVETAHATVVLLQSIGLEVTTLCVSDKFGNKVNLKYGTEIEKKNMRLSIDKALYLKDNLCISDRSYRKLSKSLNQLPRLKQLQKRAKEINAIFPVHIYNGMIGAWQPLNQKLQFVADQMSKTYPDEPVPNHIGVKISGDGTRIGKRIHCVNITFRVIYGKHLSSEYILGMVRKPEKYKFLCTIFEPIVANLLDNVSIGNESVSLKFYLGADMKFLNEMMGLGACSSKYSCVWCKCPSNERYIHTRKWSMLDVELGARTVEEITSLSTLSKNKNMSCVAPPILPFIPVHNVVADPLHLFLRISDQLVLQLIQILRHRHNVGKNSKSVDLSKCQNIAAFEEFVRDLSLPWSFYTCKESAQIQYRDFTGPEHIKVQKHINLDNLIPWHSKTHQIKWLWKEFRDIMTIMKSENADPEAVETRARAWVSNYAQTFHAKDVTPYMHTFMNHVSESLKLHGPINNFSQQAMEKLNDKVTSLFFRSTNHRNTEAFIQVMQKQNRISYLSQWCQDDLEYHVRCSRCGEAGHNKRTCHLKIPPFKQGSLIIASFAWKIEHNLTLKITFY